MDMLALADLDDDALREAYTAPKAPWWRLNFVATVDGAIRGSDGLSGSINNDADERVFTTLREISDVVVVGAGTARAEDYQVNERPVVVVSRSGAVPETLGTSPRGTVLLATVRNAPLLSQALDVLGKENVLLLGDDEVDLDGLRDEIHARGWQQVLCEGGPHLAADLVAAGQIDELCLTVVPLLLGGESLRLLAGARSTSAVALHQLIEHHGTLLQRWWINPA
ncbi:MAG: dihydrofolate reductase family protein [Nocardioides sp.]|jgi:riboflavin biosynthesis pyrimidine reductase